MCYHQLDNVLFIKQLTFLSNNVIQLSTIDLKLSYIKHLSTGIVFYYDLSANNGWVEV